MGNNNTFWSSDSDSETTDEDSISDGNLSLDSSQTLVEESESSTSDQSKSDTSSVSSDEPEAPSTMNENSETNVMETKKRLSFDDWQQAKELVSLLIVGAIIMAYVLPQVKVSPEAWNGVQTWLYAFAAVALGPEAIRVAKKHRK